MKEVLTWHVLASDCPCPGRLGEVLVTAFLFRAANRVRDRIQGRLSEADVRSMRIFSNKPWLHVQALAGDISANLRDRGCGVTCSNKAGGPVASPSAGERHARQAQ
jgi:hypothetical protein